MTPGLFVVCAKYIILSPLHVLLSVVIRCLNAALIKLKLLLKFKIPLVIALEMPMYSRIMIP